MTTTNSLLTATPDEMVEISRRYRRALALQRCDCGKCTDANLSECEVCGRYQPRCLINHTQTAGMDVTVCSFLAAPETCQP